MATMYNNGLQRCRPFLFLALVRLAAVERERGFARAVAHELRTPLAVMRTVTEHSLSHSESDSARKSLTALLTTVEGMTRSVDGLLSLVRYEAGLGQIEEEPVELGGLITIQFGLLQQRFIHQHRQHRNCRQQCRQPGIPQRRAQSDRTGSATFRRTLLAQERRKRNNPARRLGPRTNPRTRRRPRRGA
ncbi:hypothetical protein ELE36_15765 [Pseudolysobacter antarcticus]|uniref:histidine kinase n=1 Tax=Pseudolysobacter antarcticus TaxID=2511995 RepID=A0A411HMJ7_9GAMM|nr:hypothetical protein ELE36_15765 [Pseudolysobacter antarcticus]